MKSHLSGQSWSEFISSDKAEAQDILFASTCWCADAVVSCII